MTKREMQRLDRIRNDIDQVESYTEQIKSLESQARALRAKRAKHIVRLNKQGMSERAIGKFANMAGPSVHEILVNNKKVAA